MTSNRSAVIFALALLAPALIYITIIVAYPLFDTVVLSFTNAALRPTYDFIGWANYQRIFNAGNFTEVIIRTFIWTFFSVATKMVIGTLGATLLNAAIPGQTVFRILTMPPWIVPMAIGIFMWGWMYNGQFGTVSGLLQNFGIISKPWPILAQGSSAFWATIITDVWIGVPMVTIHMLAAMQSIPKDLYEAAWTDGAGRGYRFRRITLPLLVPALLTMSLLSLIATFNSFDIIWILTQGGPSNQTTTMIIDTYKTAIGSRKYGEGAARAVVICIFVSIFCLVYFRAVRKLSQGEAKMTDVPHSQEVAAADSPAIVGPARKVRARSTKAMIDRYKWYEVVAMYCGMAVFLFFVLAPFIEGFLVSLKPLAQLFSTPYSFIPENGSFDAYINMWNSVPALGRHIFNSFFISTVVTLIVIAIVVPAAYAFARFQFAGSALLLGAFLAVNMFSGAVLLIPLLRLMTSLKLLNTYWAMIVPGAAFLIPSSIWLLRTYMMRIPRELDEAAWVDGASRLYTLRRVILPLAMPGIVVVAIMTFIGAYAQQFIFALTFNSKTEFMPLPIGLFAFFGKQEVIWNELMAASFVGILPVMIVIVFLQRYLVAGLTAGAVKQ